MNDRAEQHTIAFIGAAKRWARTGLSSCLDFLYPPSCPVCTKATAQHDAFCADCWKGISFIERPFCNRLALPFDSDPGGEFISLPALADPPVFQRTRAAVRYDDTGRLIVHRLKYNDRMELARLIAAMMVRAGRDLFPDAELILPVPLHSRRLLKRRFNQAALLSARIARSTHLPYALSVLERCKQTSSQVGLSRSERAANLQGAFRVTKRYQCLIENRSILLVDDVMTTGATANACARTLLRAGAREVNVLVFARVAIS